MPKAPKSNSREAETQQSTSKSSSLSSSNAKASSASSRATPTTVKPRSLGVSSATSAVVLKDSTDFRRFPEQNQLFFEDFERDKDKQLVLVKIPPAVHIASLSGKSLSNRHLRAQVVKCGKKRNVELTHNMESCNADLDKWTIFLPSRKSGDRYCFVPRQLEGSVTLNYATSTSAKRTETN